MTDEVCVHYDSDRVMNVNGHASTSLFRAVRSYLETKP